MDGTSEIETQVNSDAGDTVEIIGTPRSQRMVIGSFGPLQVRHISADEFGSFDPQDLQTDIVAGGGIGSPHKLIVHGGLFADQLLGRGGPGGSFTQGSKITLINPIFPTKTQLQLFGGPDNDELSGGDAIRDTLKGEEGNDTLRSNDGSIPDIVDGGPGFDTVFMDNGDSLFDGEQKIVVSVGKLGLSRRVLDARAEAPAPLTVKWSHPGSRLTRQKRTVTARLGLRLPKELAGKRLDVSVWAVDAAGRNQVESNAGLIRVK